jgi:hypothetical protein
MEQKKSEDPYVQFRKSLGKCYEQCMFAYVRIQKGLGVEYGDEFALHYGDGFRRGCEYECRNIWLNPCSTIKHE